MIDNPYYTVTVWFDPLIDRHIGEGFCSLTGECIASGPPRDTAPDAIAAVVDLCEAWVRRQKGRSHATTSELGPVAWPLLVEGMR